MNRILIILFSCYHSLIVANPFYSDYNLVHTRLNLNMTNTSAYIQGSCAISFVVQTDHLPVFNIELHRKFIVDSILYKDKTCVFSNENNLLSVKLPESLSFNTFATVIIYYKGDATTETTHSWGGTKSVRDWRFPFHVTYTMAEPFYAKDWFPCKQDLNDKIDSLDLFIRVPDSLFATGNGKLIHQQQMDNFITYHWKSNYPTAYYLLAIVVGKYEGFHFYAPVSDQDSVLIQNFYYPHPNFLETEKENMLATKQIISYYSDILGRYPFYKEKYAHVFAPFPGGMEHQTISTMGGLAFGLVAHELAHQWFGNYVTCASWQDIWINEGFASYIEYLAIEKFKPEDKSNWLSTAFSYAMENPNGSVYIPSNEREVDDRIFSYDLSYKKGAVLLHMIRNQLNNDDLFFSILKGFLNEYAFRSATGNDFKNYLNKESGTDFNTFFDQWYTGFGYPIYTIAWESKNDSLIIQCFQNGSSQNTPLFNSKIEIVIESSNHPDTLVEINQTASLMRQAYYLKGVMVKNIVVDPQNKILKLAGVQKINSKSSAYLIYPNPATDSLQIECIDESNERLLFIYDLKGQLLIQSPISNKLNSISFNNLAAGNYIAKIAEGSNVFIHPFIIMK